MPFKILVFTLIVVINVYSQNGKNHAFVDDQGVLRWENSLDEVHGFGVNYSVPFAHAYRTAQRLGVDPKMAIDRDVYHFSRLGFDLYRLHVWDTEISDTLGNLIENEHLDAFDYLLYKLTQRDINYVITPIAYWGNGWPEPDKPTPGFSYRYGKGNCLTDPACIKAQKNYLTQFLNHVNPYTGIAYKDDPRIIAFEVSNEPHHEGEAAAVTAFVSGMVDAMKSTGTKKPIFYNISHSIQFAQAYFDGGIDGGTFQWYPTGLTYGRDIPGNVLPNVDRYDIPFADIIRKNKGAMLVYEFDVADVGKNYPYPVVARSFREAGIQIATHFSYDPTYMAHVNTEYNTHYMNLSYTPKKALALMIAGKVFHEVDRFSNFGTYPDNLTFGNTRVSYEKDLAVYNSEKSFIYTNDNDILPENKKKLEHIAGFGNSGIIEYDGEGAYFLDRISRGVWRLEVMPDAIWVDNPFGRNSPDKTIAVIRWDEHTMNIQLDDLGDDFSITPINEGNRFTPIVDEQSFSIAPGTYILSSNRGRIAEWSADQQFLQGTLNEFYAAPPNATRWYVSHQPATTHARSTPLTIEVQIAGPQHPDSVVLMAYAGWRAEYITMTRSDSYLYKAEIPTEKLQNLQLDYYIVTYKDAVPTSYPPQKQGLPTDWDFYDRTPYTTTLVADSARIYLFDARDDNEELVRPWRRGIYTRPTSEYKEAEYVVDLDPLYSPEDDLPYLEPVKAYTIKHYVKEEITNRSSSLDDMNTLVIRGRALNDTPCPVQISFVTASGASFGKIITLMPGEIREYPIALDELSPVKTVLLPRPYPTFLPYYLEHNIDAGFDIAGIEALQISVGPGIADADRQNAFGFGLIRAWLE